MQTSNNLFSVSGKVALVTGGSRGIGLMIARGLVEAGAKVYISSRKAEVCDAVAEELSELGECISLPADVGSDSGTADLAARLTKLEPALNILVNNAGTNWAAPLSEYTDEAFDKVMSVNVRGIFNLTRNLLDPLGRGGTAEDPARVINIGSIDGLGVPVAETYAYSASKAAVHHLTRTLAKNLAPSRITVNAVAPGPFQSKMMKQTLELFGEQIVKAVPLSRIGCSDDMAGVVIFLSSKAGAYLTGAVIPVDGGMSACR